MDKELKYYLQQTFHLPGIVNEVQDAELFLADQVNELINNNFNHLVQILYRMDVDENRLKKVLKDNPDEDAGRIIAQLIIDRQLKKQQLRQQFTTTNQTFNEEEKWQP